MDPRVRGWHLGNDKRPFNSITAALRFAEIRDLKQVEVRVLGGVYSEGDIRITRDVRIVGPGLAATSTAQLALSLINTGEHTLALEGVVLVPDGSSPAVVSVENAAATTVLCNVAFAEQVGYALSQTGGSLIADHVTFESIKRDPAADDEDYVSGTALVLRGGALASLHEVEVHGTEGSALYAGDIGTEVTLNYAARSIPPDTAAITGSFGCLGAVAVADGAYLSGDRLTLDENRFLGVAVNGNGSRAEFEFLSVTNTRALREGDVTFPLCGRNSPTASAAAFLGGALHISGSPDEPFILSDSALLGLRIVAVQGAIPDVRLLNGIVGNNPIGVGIDIDDCGDFSFLVEDNVLWKDNEVNLDAPCLPVPKPSVEIHCNDGVDDDGDGLTDGADPDCAP